MHFLRPYHVAELPPMAVQYHYHVTPSVTYDQYNWTAIGGSYGLRDTDIYIILSIIYFINEKLLNSNIIEANLCFLDSSGISSFSDWLCIYWIWSV